MKPIGTKELHTGRMILREVRSCDAEDLFTSGTLGNTLDECREIVENITKYNNDPYNFHWVLEYQGHTIGRVKAWEVNYRDNYAQLGYDIGEKWRCQGLMTEAVHAVIQYLLLQAEFNRVYCMVRDSNFPSVRVCEKAGMTFEGTMRKHFMEHDGSYVDVKIFGILASEL